MKLPLILLSLFGCLVLSGCASSSGVVRTGPDEYMIARSEKGVRGASGPIKAKLIKQANEYCERQGKLMELISTDQKDMQPFKADAQAEVYFRCVDPEGEGS